MVAIKSADTDFESFNLSVRNAEKQSESFEVKTNCLSNKAIMCLPPFLSLFGRYFCTCSLITI